MSLTEEDVKRIIAEQSKPQSKINQDVVQWLVRSAYEEGWRAAGGDPTLSPHDAEPVGWRAEWMVSAARGVLIRNGLISEEDAYK